MGCNEAINIWFQKINEKKDCSIAFTKAEFPFHSTFNDFNTQILITLCIGYYSYECGCKNIGPSYLQACIKPLSAPVADFEILLKECVAKSLN